jgi:hypothetical protein
MFMIHSYFYNRNLIMELLMVDHYRQFHVHEINLDTIALNMLIYQFNNIIYHNHSSYFVSIFHHNNHHHDNKIYHYHFFDHLTYNQHIYHHSHILIIHINLYIFVFPLILKMIINQITQELSNYFLTIVQYLDFSQEFVQHLVISIIIFDVIIVIPTVIAMIIYSIFIMSYFIYLN